MILSALQLLRVGCVSVGREAKLKKLERREGAFSREHRFLPQYLDTKHTVYRVVDR